MNIGKRMAEILQIQQKAITALKIDKYYALAVEKICQAQQNDHMVITTGMGKAGIIAQKMSATMASIGIPSFFLNPAEALHGDLGRVHTKDLLIVFSHSGATSEVYSMLTSLHGLNNKSNEIILISGIASPQFPVDILISYGKIEESSIVSSVPSTSTTIMLIIADVVAISAAESLGLDDGWFKLRHPGGSIGKKYNEKIR